MANGADARVMERPETRFAWNGDAALAYQVVGDGATDLLYLQGWISNVELNWEHPIMSRFLRGLARSRRLIVTDPRGVGISERASPRDVWPLETKVEDVAVVLDAAGSQQAAILATVDCGFVASMFAATYPERTSGLILYESSANWLWSEDTPWEWTEERFEEQERQLRSWGTLANAVEQVRMWAPSMVGDHGYLEWYHRYNLLSESAGHVVAAPRKYKDTDIRGILPSIHVPVLVLVRPLHPEPSMVPSAHYLADHIPGARLRELPGRDSDLSLGDQASVLHAVDGFLDEVRRERSELERALATVLFTDIVNSTAKAAELGDRAWRDLIGRHHAHVRALLDRYRGVEVDTAGDGFFATFDGPARAVRCARAIVEGVRPLGIEVRAGVHTGEVETMGDNVGGIAVSIGARVAGYAARSEVLVSQTVKDLVTGSGLTFEDAGEQELKGIPDRWRLYRAVGG